MLGAVFALSTVVALQARADLDVALDEIQLLRRELDVDAVLHGDGVDRVRVLADRFQRVADRLGGALLRPSRALPVLGRQVEAASAQAGAAAAAVGAAGEVLAEVRRLAEDSLPDPTQRVTELERLTERLDVAAAAIADLDLGPSDGLLEQLGRSRHLLDVELSEGRASLADLRAAVQGTRKLLEGPNDFLVLASNNSQMQNGQGMFLSAGLMRFEGGRMSLLGMEPLDRFPLPAEPVPLDQDLRDRWGWLDPNDDWRHLGLSPRFDVAAETAAAMWVATGHDPVDGVLALDVQALAAIVKATGPVTTSTGTYDADALAAYLLHDQYAQYFADGFDRSFQEERREELSEFATAALHRLDERPDGRQLLQSLVSAANGRHLLAWSADPEIDAAFDAAGVEGAIGEDSMLLSLVNRSGVKLDWFTSMTARVTTTPMPEGTEVAVTINVRNRAPRRGEPRYVIGPYPNSGLSPGEYLGVLTLNLPAAARDGRFDGVESLAVAGQDGDNRVIATMVRIEGGRRLQLTARFTVPASEDLLWVAPSARPIPTVWRYEGREWDDAARHRLRLG